MMTLQQAPDDTFDNLLLRMREGVAEHAQLSKLREMAWDVFCKKGLPSTRDEVYRYIPLKKLYAKGYEVVKSAIVSKEVIAPWILPECKNSVIVYINGAFSPELSTLSALPAGIVCLSLTEALRTYGTFIQNQWQRSIKDEKDPFALINAALHPNAAFIYIPPKHILKHPIQILSVINAEDKPVLVLPRWQLYAGNNSSVEIITRQTVLSGGNHAAIGAFDIVMEDNSRAKVTQISFSDNDDAWLLESGRALLKRDSVLESVSLMKGGESSRMDWHVQLAGENSEANLNGLGLFDKKHEGHVHILMEHRAPHCRSMQFFRNVLKDSSRSSFEGKIYVHQTAQKTDAFQLNNNLLLSESAQAYSKPNLEIFTDDVKASHGATVGQLDEEQLFYLKARGLNHQLAQNLLIQGFCREITDKITMSSLSQEIVQAVAQYIAAS